MRAPWSTRACSPPSSSTTFFPDLADERFASALARRALPVLHQHVPELAAGAPVPVHRPQRRDQHRDGQPQLDAGPRGAARSATSSRATSTGCFPICTPGASDSASFDEVLELLHLGGRSLPHAVLMMIPEAWENHAEMDPARRDFYEFHSALMEPWDGPACVVFTDGTPDRRGARPQRPAARRATGSPTTAWSCWPPRSACSTSTRRRVVRKGRLQPGRMFLVDTDEHRIVEDDEIKAELAAEHPYDEWLHAGLIHLDDLPDARAHRAHARLGDPAPADLRLHRGGAAGPARRRWPAPAASRSARWAPTRPIAALQRPAAAAVRLLQPAVRAGHQPAAGRDPRGARHLAERHDRAGGEPARADAGVAAARSCCRSRSSTTTSSPRSATSTATATCRASSRHVSRGLYRGRRRRRGAGAPARRDLRGGVRRRSPAAPASSCSPTGTPTPTWRRSRRCCSPAPCTTTWCARRPAPRSGLLVEAGDVREVHHVALLDRLRRGGGQPLPRDGVGRGPRPRGLLRRRRARGGRRATSSRRSARACSR